MINKNDLKVLIIKSNAVSEDITKLEFKLQEAKKNMQALERDLIKLIDVVENRGY